MGGLTAGPNRQISLKDTRLSRPRAVRLPLTPRSVRAHQVLNVLHYPSCDPPETREGGSQGRKVGPTTRDAILCSKLKGHQAAVTAALITSDAAGCKEIITGSLDKTMTLWRLQDGSADGDESSEASTSGAHEIVTLTPSGAPIFSLAIDPSGLNPNERQQVFCGNASKSISVWEPPSGQMQDKVILNGHTGWVRALAAEGRWLFSAGCNVMRQWDLTRAVPRHVRDVKLVKGDILGIATRRGFVYTCGADGSIRSWAIDKKGNLEEGRAREKAHRERVTALLAHNGFLYSVSYDGSVKMWDADSMELVMEAANAHEGGRVNCAAIGPDGNLYTGGDDKLVRRWRLGSLNPAPSNALFCHNYSVRALAAGSTETLVSGDQSGEIAFWRI
ncbi:WD40 repeat-like protein [Coccomyxa subellipsoidea C-169]|uniref:WD40 repeat-like protein n=1 Tax=Coccomyxa subellipsoidea (strain C-169) TaxID=574566 RepID=I0YXV9_COCSC|nr:WD40 repeat-like protein [Coccomyxa subellipsoidea C-169]EIE23228.1 WD40 repeat-like protein [Coccomyxa subellipsoidea C-169]|eukprot:XP_005647772.1 WD40 repeat-like protein [Coccomyxa subellipsoidea C-169]